MIWYIVSHYWAPTFKINQIYLDLLETDSQCFRKCSVGVSSLMGWIKFLVDVGGAEALVSKHVCM